jgi:hypothetical protein
MSLSRRQSGTGAARRGVRPGTRQRVLRLLDVLGARRSEHQIVSAQTEAEAPASPTGVPSAARAAALSFGELASLIYELLDAHDDTARIARHCPSEDMWEAHLDYLRALQRRGREVLAMLDVPAPGPAAEPIGE